MWVRIPRPKIDKLACQAQSAGIFAMGEYPSSYQTSVTVVFFTSSPFELFFEWIAFFKVFLKFFHSVEQKTVFTSDKAYVHENPWKKRHAPKLFVFTCYFSESKSYRLTAFNHALRRRQLLGLNTHCGRCSRGRKPLSYRLCLKEGVGKEHKRLTLEHFGVYLFTLRDWIIIHSVIQLDVQVYFKIQGEK